jgi:hypothetical protein
MASQEKVTLPSGFRVAPFSGVSRRKHGISVGVAVSVGVGVSVEVGVGVFVAVGSGVSVFVEVAVATGVLVGLTSFLHAARNAAPRLNKVALMKSRRENLISIFGIPIFQPRPAQSC